MSAPLTQAMLVAGAREHTLKRVRLGDLLTETDLQAFRAPYGERWHKLGGGQPAPERIELTGAVEADTRELASAALQALLADLPHVDTLKLGTWGLPLAGSSGNVVITPTLAGWQLQVTLIRAQEA